MEALKLCAFNINIKCLYDWNGKKLVNNLGRTGKEPSKELMEETGNGLTRNRGRK